MRKASPPSTTPSDTSTDSQDAAGSQQPETELAIDPEVAPFDLESITGGHSAGGSHSPLSGQALSQNPTLAKRGYAEAMRFLEKSGLPGEQIEYIVTTNQSSLSSVTGCAIVTNKRLITLKMLGLDKPLIDDCLWTNIEDIKLFESVSGVTLVISTADNSRHTMEALPRHQAQVVVGYGLMHSEAMRKHSKYAGAPLPVRGPVPSSQPKLSAAQVDPAPQDAATMDEPEPFVPPGQQAGNWGGTTSSRLRSSPTTTTSGSLSRPPTGPQSLDDLPIESLMKRTIQSSGAAAAPAPPAPAHPSSGGSILESIMRASQQVEVMPADEIGAALAENAEQAPELYAAPETQEETGDAPSEEASAATHMAGEHPPVIARQARTLSEAVVAQPDTQAEYTEPDGYSAPDSGADEAHSEPDEPTVKLREWSEHVAAAAHSPERDETHDEEPFKFEAERTHQYMTTGPIDEGDDGSPAFPVGAQPTWHTPEQARVPAPAQPSPTLHDTSGSLNSHNHEQNNLKARHISTPLRRNNAKSTDDLVQKMKQLKELLEIGIISEEEFTQKKLELLDRL
jgi:hypothetical protein